MGGIISASCVMAEEEESIAGHEVTKLCYFMTKPTQVNGAQALLVGVNINGLQCYGTPIEVWPGSTTNLHPICAKSCISWQNQALALPSQVGQKSAAIQNSKVKSTKDTDKWGDITNFGNKGADLERWIFSSIILNSVKQGGGDNSNQKKEAEMEMT